MIHFFKNMVSSTDNNTKTFPFNADISQLMSLIINTFYSNKDIAIRELVSNASDALDKMRHILLTESNKITHQDLTIKLQVEKETNCIIIQDNGIGMTNEDLINTLGTIAKSGTKSFMEQLKKTSSDTSTMIGQFGVGFYSAFLIADKVDVVTKHYTSDITYVWSSNGSDSFTIRIADNNEFDIVDHGTKLFLYMKESTSSYLESSKITEIIQRHSEFINYPIMLKEYVRVDAVSADSEPNDTTSADSELNDTEPNDTTSADSELNDTEPNDTTSADSELNDTEPNDTTSADSELNDTTSADSEPNDTEKEEWRQLNNQKPIWTREVSTITTDEYTTFYNAITKKTDEKPAAYKHFQVEGKLEFRGVLYTPSRAPFDMFQKNTEKSNNIRLYVKRIFITDNCKDLVPDYLQFVCGVVDSEDLPLNVSREMLQENNILKVIRKHIVKKSLEMFNDLANDNNEMYLKFYDAFSKNLKLGVHEDSKNRTKIMELLRYQTSMSNGKMVSLDECIERRKDDTVPLYYMTGEDITAVKTSPLLERLFQQGHEVIFMTDTIDEYVVQQVSEYKDCKLVSASKEGLSLNTSDDEKKTMDESMKRLQPLCDAVQTILGKNIEKVILSNRVVSSPCCLVSGEYGWSANMERIMKAQALGDSSMMAFMGARRTLELNPNHIIVKNMFNKLILHSVDDICTEDTKSNDVCIEEVDDDNDNDKDIKSVKKQTLDPDSINTIRDAVWLLYDSCSLSSGFSVKNISKFSDRINDIVKMSLEQ
jgi:molecular chaperone HtpG